MKNNALRKSRPEGSDPPRAYDLSLLGQTPSWTGGDVLLWMKRAFGTNPRTRNLGEARPLSWPAEHLSPSDPNWARKRDVLLLWARCRAEGMSFDAICRGRGWSPASTYRLRDEAAAEIAARINEAIVEAHKAVLK